jgi:hypothetical protein
MRTLALAAILGLGLSTGACTVGAVGPGGDDTSGDDTSGDDTPGDGTVSGAINADQSWSGTIVITGEATIAPGVTVTVEPGTEITAKDGVALHVSGTLDAVGTDAARLTLLPTADAQTWAGIVADTGGSVHLAYADGTDVATLLTCKEGAALCQLDHLDFTGISQAIVAEGTASLEASRITEVANGGVSVRGNGNLHVVDSVVYTSSGDLVVASGGTMLIEYSEIGDTTGSYDHCNFHIGAAASLTITRTNIINGVYGMMLGGTTGASITYNNWMGNDTDLSPVGTNITVDLTHNYWEAGPPNLGAVYDTSNPELAIIADAGPRI